MGAAATLSQEFGNVIQTIMTREGSEFVASNQVMKLASVAIFACFIFLIESIPFRKIFLFCSAFSFLLLFSSIFIFQRSNATYFITSVFCPSILPLLGWAYINQMLSPVEGIKYYFLLNAIVGLAITPFRLISSTLLKYGLSDNSDSLLSPLWLLILFSLIALCFALVWTCDRWIYKKFYRGEQQQKIAIAPNKSWTSILLLAVILSSLKQVTLLNGALVKTKIQEITGSMREYLIMMHSHVSMMGIGIFILVLLSLFIGPRILQSKGWRFGILITPVIAGLAIIMVLITPNPFILHSEQAILNGLESAWIFPLIQVAFLYYVRKSRFVIQAWIFLVVAPIIELGFRFAKRGLEILNIGWIGDIVSAFFILGIMILSAFLLTRGDKTLSRVN